MKKLIATTTIVLLTLGLTGCGKDEAAKEAEHIRQLECIEATGDRYCRGKGELEILEEREENRYRYANVAYGPTMPGAYTNYYGNPQYGYWGPEGFMFYDPYGIQATQTHNYLMAAGLGGLAAYAILNTRDKWTSSNPGGWKESKRETKQYIGKGGVILDKAEADRRAAQSAKDKAKHQAKLKAEKEAKQKAKQEQAKAKQAADKAQRDKENREKGLLKKQEVQNAKKAAEKPTVEQTNAKKEELKASLEKRKADKAAGKKPVGESLKANEQKAANPKPAPQPVKTIKTPVKPKVVTAPKPKPSAPKPYKAPPRKK